MKHLAQLLYLMLPVVANVIRAGLALFRQTPLSIRARNGDDGDLGRSKQAYWRPPCSGAIADIQPPSTGHPGQTGIHPIEQAREIAERKDLSAMDMPGEL